MEENSFATGTQVEYSCHYTNNYQIVEHEVRTGTFMDTLKSVQARVDKPDYIELISLDAGGMAMVPIGHLAAI